MNINFFFSEHYDYKIINRLPNEDINYVIHGIFLTKIKTDKKFNFIFENFTQEDQKKIYNKKKIINNYQIKNFNKIIDKNLYRHLSEFSFFSLNRLFFHHNFSCYDAIFFIKKNKNFLKNKNIKIYVGENYRLTELFTILFWIMLLKKTCKSIEIIWLSRNKNIFYKNNLNKFYDEKIFSNTNQIKIKKNFKNFENENLLWVEGLRDRDYWYKKISPLILYKENNNFSTSVQFDVSNKIKFEFKSKFNEIEKKINNKNIFNTNVKSNLVTIFYESFILQILENFFIDAEKKILQIIDINKVKTFYTPSAPLIESIILQNIMIKNNIDTILLPHSSTPSHEFHPQTYKIQYCKIKSEFFMPSAKWIKLSNKKEEVIQVIKEPNKNKKISFLKLNVNFSKKFFSLYNLSKILEYIYNYFDFIYQKKFLIKKIKNFDSNLLIFLNVEIYEMLSIQDFNNLNDVLSKLHSICKFNNINFLIRRKPNWTNFFLLKKKILKFNDLKKLFLLHDQFSVEEICKLCNFALFTQGSSAILEVMKYNKPVFFFKDTNLRELNEPYIHFEKELVPEINFNNLDLLRNKKYLDKIRKKQQYFYKQQII